MRRVLMVFVILAAVMGGEARAVVVMGRVRSDCCDRQAEFSGGTIAAEYTVTAAAGSAWTVPLAVTVQHVRGPDLGGGTKGLLDSLRNGLSRFNHYNGRGEVVAQSDIDGTTTWAASYQADGRGTVEAGTNGEWYRANGKLGDPTGLLNEGFRYRDMETAAFFSRDPLGLVDGPNVYCYVPIYAVRAVDGSVHNIDGNHRVIGALQTRAETGAAQKLPMDLHTSEGWEAMTGSAFKPAVRNATSKSAIVLGFRPTRR